jgi:hypothetical protein
VAFLSSLLVAGMRSFRNKVVSAVAWAVPVLAAALPGHAATEVARPESSLLQLDVQPNYAQATFSLPCTGCLGHGHTDQHDESLILSFRTTHLPGQSCGASNLTLNGVDLPQLWNGDTASGQGSFVGVATLDHEWLPQRDLDLEWNSTCLYGPADADQPAQCVCCTLLTASSY